MEQGKTVFCIDVECAATSKRHSDRTPISVAVVNEKEEVLLHCFIKPKEPVFSYLTPLTGVCLLARFPDSSTALLLMG